jgi:hypothetical protein
VKTTLQLSFLVAGSIALMVFVCGCQETSSPKNEECRKVYEQNQHMNNYKYESMEQYHFQDMYPIYSKEFLKTHVIFQNVDEVCSYFCTQIEKHPFAKYVSTFDHYGHTLGIEDGFVDKTIMAAKVVLFCFGKKLTDPKVLSVRPRAIGICETDTHYVISFLEAPNPLLTEIMIKWVSGIKAVPAYN